MSPAEVIESARDGPDPAPGWGAEVDRDIMDAAEDEVGGAEPEPEPEKEREAKRGKAK